MFSGIIEAVGEICEARPAEDGVRLRIDCGALPLGEVSLGDSIAVAGCCLTVVGKGPRTLDFDASGETLRCTVGLSANGPVNLEQALRMGDRLGGHLVTGHVDGIGTVTRYDAVGESRLLEVEVPAALSRYIARKGSVTIDGVSLTVNAVEATQFAVNLIPHTLAVTTLGALAPGRQVNIEIDLLARYVERALTGGLDPSN